MEEQLTDEVREERLARERERYASRRAYLLGRQRCYRCGKQDAFTLNGRTMCAECVEYNRLQAKKNRPKYKEQIKAAQQKLYYTRKEAGFCPECGRPRDGHTVYCKRCATMRRKNQNKNYGVQVLRCKHCENMPEPGSAYCSECKKRQSESMKKYWEEVRSGKREGPIQTKRQKYGGIV